jgi:hypothetical protein
LGIANIENRNLGIAGAQEVAVERMADTAFDSPTCGHQSLAQHLAAEYALHAVFWALAAKDIFLDLLKIEQVENFRDGRFGFAGHGAPIEGQTFVRKASRP